MKSATLFLITLLLLAALDERPAAAWTPETHVEIARQAATIAPPDLFRQIKKHEKRFVAGLQSELARTQSNHATRKLLSTLAAGAGETVSAIKSHRPFEEIIFSLGRLAFFAADANNPLAHSAADPRERTYAADFERYVRSAFPRFPVVFYGEGRDVTSRRALDHLLTAIGDRGRELYPMIGREYRRVGKIDGVAEFDDRSTAFGVGSLTFSHAVSDLAAVYRYIWLEAGGADRRTLPITPPETDHRSSPSR